MGLGASKHPSTIPVEAKLPTNQMFFDQESQGFLQLHAFVKHCETGVPVSVTNDRLALEKRQHRQLHTKLTQAFFKDRLLDLGRPALGLRLTHRTDVKVQVLTRCYQMKAWGSIHNSTTNDHTRTNQQVSEMVAGIETCLLYTSPSPRDA